MATPQTQPQTKLELKHTCAASRERVFRAWSDARELAQWFHPSSDHSAGPIASKCIRKAEPFTPFMARIATPRKAGLQLALATR